jgi:hypothetical protein
VNGSGTRRWEQLLLLASVVYLVSLFFPWGKASFPGTLYGWDSFLGVVCGLAAFALLVSAHASLISRVSPLVDFYAAAALAFFTTTRLINEDVLRPSGLTPAWAAYVGIAAAAVALAASLVVLAGGWRRFVDRLPGFVRVDRI